MQLVVDADLADERPVHGALEPRPVGLHPLGNGGHAAIATVERRQPLPCDALPLPQPICMDAVMLASTFFPL